LLLEHWFCFSHSPMGWRKMLSILSTTQWCHGAHSDVKSPHQLGCHTIVLVSCQYHVTSPVKSSRLVIQSHSSSYATRHRKGPISPLILCVRLIYEYCIPCSIYVVFFEHGWMVKTRFLYYISCHNICDIRWMIWGFLIATNTWALMISWMTIIHIHIYLVIHLLIQTNWQCQRICFKLLGYQANAMICYDLTKSIFIFPFLFFSFSF